MDGVELRDLDDARRFVAQGLWLQRATVPTAASVRPALEWSFEAATGGRPLPPVGFIADLGHAALSPDGEPTANRSAPPPGLPVNLVRTYEDHVLGKLYADGSFARAGDALRRYQGRERARGLAFLLQRFQERAGFGGALFSPGVLKAMLDDPPEEVLARGWESLRQDGAQPLLLKLVEALVAAARRTAEVLAPEDVAALEAGDALAEEGEQLARRQVRQAAAALEASLPAHRPRPTRGPGDAPTRVLDEDAYPVGGFSSLSTRGSVESLLWSQLAYMEQDDRPDLFDVKFLRDELLYYSRDENQFLRRRRSFVFALQPDLAATRFKDPGLPYQRGVLLLALLTVAVRKLTEWLSAEALLFEIVFIGDGKDEPLAAERALLATLMRDSIGQGTTLIARISAQQLAAHCAAHARRSECRCLVVGVNPAAVEAADVDAATLRIDGPRPEGMGKEDDGPSEEDPMEAWSAALARLLARWV
jgi:hypothetical protein